MFQFLFSLFWKKSDDAREAREEKDKPVQSESGYVYTDYKAKLREAKRKKKTEQKR
jgi:hypothetical protein